MGSIAKPKQLQQPKNILDLIFQVHKFCGSFHAFSVVTGIPSQRLRQLIAGDIGNIKINELAVMVGAHHVLKDMSLVDRKQKVIELYCENWDKKLGKEAARFNHAN